MATSKTPRAPVAKAYDNRFQVTGTTYPSDLMDPTAPYGGNYVMFRINVHQDSFISKEDGNDSFIPPGTLDPSRRSDVAGKYNAAEISAAYGIAVGAAGAGLAKVGTTAVGVDISTKGAVVAGGIAGIAGAISAVGKAKADYRTMKKAICLYMPNDLSIRYGVSWDDTSLSTTAALMSGSENLGAAGLKVGAGVIGGRIAAKALGLGKTSTAIASVLGGAIGAATASNNISEMDSIATAQALKVPGAGEMMSKSAGLVANPKKEQIFKQVDFRTFTFSYQFFPRSQDEAQAVIEIIKEFKLHMHPEFRDQQQFLYIFPSEFDIVYYTNGKENTNLHRHTSCVLTDMNVSYAPQGVYTSFANGMPTQITVQLMFRELSLLTKQDIANGY
jgi:hypothetical protein